MTVIDRQHMLETAMFFDKPDFALEQYVRSVANPAEYDLRKKIENWRNDGVVVFENAVAHDEIDALLADIDYLCGHPDDFDLEIEVRGQRYRLGDVPIDPTSQSGVKFNCIENISYAARVLSLNALVCDFLRHVFQDAPVSLQSLTFWRGSNQPVHTDYSYVRTQEKLSHLVASWIPLEDVHAEAGPLAYYPGSHNLDLVPPFDWGGGSVVLEPDSVRRSQELAPYLREKIESAKLQRKVYLPKKGDLLIWHGWLAHEGSPVLNSQMTRKSYVTHYTSRGAHPDSFMFPDVMKKKRYTHLNGGYVFDRPWVDDQRQLPSWGK